ncbi:hypothetical protein COCMIDRAFT_95250 [Bipolaris oryzae ATCC 44560]|uniref:Uncharacterized protein n=1 Tax=Bipolaris oryzae ATCC 44560 TaxID=930090 RepID=W6Z1A5_COCMI|nr:uncharacterized protein COCMIDRAFT_95250 [Bipolaris oryzae ATCC 44560]EUC45542.1 hypothetical protein COCMIDRAFT_95250 [Bipolaris oryzae ATCC 44560]
MHFLSPQSGLLTLSHAILALSIPFPNPTLLSSKNNVFLTTCTTRSILTDETSSSAILYAGTPSTTNPTAIGTVNSARAIQWAGSTRRVTLDGAGVFESRIERGADALPKSELAGYATLETSTVAGGKEEYACFRDGEATFRFVGGILGEETTVCKTEFWCASLPA